MSKTKPAANENRPQTTYNPARIDKTYPTMEEVFTAAKFTLEQARQFIENAKIEQSPVALAPLDDKRAIGATATEGGFLALQVCLIDCESPEEATAHALALEPMMVAKGWPPALWAIVQSHKPARMMQ